MMKRQFGWLLQVGMGMVLGCALCSFYEKIHAAQDETADVSADDDQNADMRKQLKEIQVHVKNIDVLLQSGRLKVINVINPDAPR
jgi:hypothetical protein